MTTGLIVLGVVVSVIAALLSEEAKGWLPHLAHALARAAARRLPSEYRERYQG